MPTIDFDVELGETYYIAVDSIDGMEGALSISLSDMTVGDGALPPGALGMWDFVNGVYKWGTSLYAASDVISAPEFVIPGAGLYIDSYYGSLEAVEVLPYTEFYDHIQGAEFALTYEVCAAYFMSLIYADEAGPYDWALYTEISPGSAQTNSASFFGFYGPGSFVELYDTPEYMSIPDRAMYALSISDSNNAINAAWDTGIYGNIVYTASNPNAFPTLIGGIWIGGDGGGAFENLYIARIVFYPYAGATLTDYLQEPIMQAPANDDLADAEVINVDDVIETDNFTASIEEGEPNHGGTFLEPTSSLWYKFTAPSSISYTITGSNTISDNDDLIIAIYTAASPLDVSTLSLVARNHNGWPHDPSVAWTATSGVTYYIAIDGDSGVRGFIDFTLEET